MLRSRVFYLYSLVFLIPLVFLPGGINAYEFGKQGFLLLVIGLFTLLFALALVLGKQNTTQISTNKMIFLVLLLYGLSFGLSTVFSIAPVESFFGSYERLQGTLTFLFYGIHFLILTQLFQEKRFQRIFFGLVLFTGVLIALYAILQRMGIEPLPIPRDPFPGRSFATLGFPNGLGQFLIFPFFIALFVSIASWTNGHGKNARIKGFLFFLITILTFAALLFSKNRASLLGIVITIFLLFLYELKGLRKLLPVLGLMLTALALWYLFGSDLRSLGTRALLWKNSLSLVPQHFFFGSGPETYYQTIQTVFPEKLYFFERLTDIPDRSHNELLDIFLTRGVFGFLLAFVNIGFLAWVFLKRKIQTYPSKIAFASIIAHLISVQFGFSLATDMVLLTAMWSVLLISTLQWKTVVISRLVSGLRQDKLLMRAGKTVVTMALLALSVGSFTLAYHRTATDVFFGKAIDAFLFSEEKSLTVFGNAINNSPNFSYPYRSVFLLFTDYAKEHQEFIPTLENYAARLRRVTNGNFQYDIAKAKLAMVKNDYKEATQFFKRASGKAPNLALLYLAWGETAFSEKDFETAITQFEKLVSLAPPYWRWKPDLSERPPKEKEAYRIFRLSNQGFYEALAILSESYERVGNFPKAQNLKPYL